MRTATLVLLAATTFVPALGAHAQAPAVDWEGFIRVGGIEQWVSIRGRSADNPVLLFLHGGPGEALSPFPGVLEPLEKDFTVVKWDQRGSGKTQGRNAAAPEDMTLERLTADAIEVTEHVLERLGKDKLVLVGQSWGSMIGWTAAKARPDLFHVYVGTGQSVGWAQTVAGQEAHARARAEAAGDTAALEAMDAARELPLASLARAAPFRPWIMPPADLEFIEMQRRYVGPEPIPEEGEVADWIGGFVFSAEALAGEILIFDAYETGIDLEIPVVFIQGRDDRVTPYDAAEQLLRDLRAPAKAFVAIDGGHFACYTNGETFAARLAEQVRAVIGQD